MPNYCPNCGKPLESESSNFCSNCGTNLVPVSIEKPKEPVEEKFETRNPATAMICSFFVPGLGQVYNGDPIRGVMIFFGTIIGAFIFLIPGLVVWIFGLYDAYTTADRMNNKKIPFKPKNTDNMILFIIFAIIMTFVIICIVVFAIIATVLASIIHR